MSYKLSIITINLNDAKGLKRTIDSVARQTRKDFEFIVIDGLSSDGSQEIIKQSACITKSISEKDTGVYNAQNKGIRLSTGNYLLFLNSGDTLFEPETLAKIFPLLDGKTDIVYGNLMIEDHGKLVEGFMPDRIDLAQMMEDTLWHPVSFISERLFREYGEYDERFRICGDYDFFFKVIIGKKVTTRHVPQFISVFQHNGLSSQPANIPVIQKEKQFIQKKYLGEKAINAYYRNKKIKAYLSRVFRWFRS